MKILFINPPFQKKVIEYPDEKGGSYIETEDFGIFTPLGPLYVLGYLEKNTKGHELFFKDCIAEKITHDDLEKIVIDINPDIVGITSFTMSLWDVLQVARTVRKNVPGAHICLGGHHPIAFPLQAARLEEFDSVVVGEGEIAFKELVDAIEKCKDINSIKGVYTADTIDEWVNKGFKDSRFLTKLMVEPGYIEDINTLPFPARSYIRHIKYRSVVGVTDDMATMITSRGCPYKCTYCEVPYRRYRQRDVVLVVDEIEECLNMGYKEIHFFDDLFNITEKKVVAFCDELERRKLKKFPWDFRGRVNAVSKESLRRAKRAGCRLISFGVETGTNEGLKTLRKKTTVQQVRNAFKWCQEIGIKTTADFMIGLPFEKTKEDILKNIDFLFSLDPDYAQISVLCLYPNTEITGRAIEKGLISNGKWEEYSMDPFIEFRVDFWEEFFSARELVMLQKEVYKKFYLRPHYIVKSILNTKSFYEFRTKAESFIKLVLR